MIAPVVEEMANKHPEIEFVKIDIDNSSVAKVVLDHSIASVPTFVSYKKGNPVFSFSGADKMQLQSMVQDLLE